MVPWTGGRGALALHVTGPGSTPGLPYGFPKPDQDLRAGLGIGPSTAGCGSKAEVRVRAHTRDVAYALKVRLLWSPGTSRGSVSFTGVPWCPAALSPLEG